MLESWLKWMKSKLLCFSSEAERGGGHEANCPRLKGAATIRSILESWLSGRKRLTANEVGVYSSSRVRIPHSPPGQFLIVQTRVIASELRPDCLIKIVNKNNDFPVAVFVFTQPVV